MKTKKRQKLCYNCEGEIDLDVIVCPFCAADLRSEKPEMNRPSYNQSLAINNFDTQQSLYPSKFANMSTAPKEEIVDHRDEEAEPQVDSLITEQEETKSVVGPTILLTMGAQLFLFGLLMCFFGQEGSMTLKWDSRLWYIYMMASVPLIAFGYRIISKH